MLPKEGILRNTKTHRNTYNGLCLIHYKNFPASLTLHVYSKREESKKIKQQQVTVRAYTLSTTFWFSYINVTRRKLGNQPFLFRGFNKHRRLTKRVSYFVREVGYFSPHNWGWERSIKEQVNKTLIKLLISIDKRKSTAVDKNLANIYLSFTKFSTQNAENCILRLPNIIKFFWGSTLQAHP